MKSRLVSLIPVLVLFIGASGHNDENQLRQYYGAPMGEVYLAADDVIVTTSLDSQRNVCKMRIEHRSHGKRLTDAEMNPVLDKIAPESDRGEYIIGMFLNLLCPPDNDCRGTKEDYKKLSITKIGGTNAYRYVTVLYHRPECEEPEGGAYKR